MRPISSAEASVVRWMVKNGAAQKSRAPSLENLLPSIEKLAVVEECKCGCPSISFVEKGWSNFPIIAEAIGKSPGADHVELILWGDQSQIATLEVVVYREDGKANVPLPAVETLRTYEKPDES